MSRAYYTKAGLYSEIEKIREKYSITTPIDPYALASRVGIEGFLHDFETKHISGVLLRVGTQAAITLNSLRPELGQKFTCLHELVHFFLHSEPSFMCSDESSHLPQEWQANEGAAQLILPYQSFIPRYIEISREEARNPWGGRVFSRLEEEYGVSESVLATRIDSLNCEIYQYLNGRDISSVSVLSRRQLSKIGWKENHIRSYCQNCLSVVKKDFSYCPICGHRLIGEGFFKHFRYKAEGAGYMIYPRIELNADGRVKECPICKNEEHREGELFCMICGKPTLNQCAYAIQDISEYGQCCHKEPLPGNARYCPYCGNKTTFLEGGVLSPWDSSETPFPKASNATEEDDDDDLPF